jgi:hypothetical protein
LRVHESEGVGGHLLDRQAGAKGLAVPQATIIEGEAFVMHRQGIDLRSPGAPVDAQALYEDSGRALAPNLINEPAAGVKK